MSDTNWIIAPSASVKPCNYLTIASQVNAYYAKISRLSQFSQFLTSQETQN